MKMATEKRLIDANALLEKYWQRVYDGEIVTLQDVRYAIENAPTVDAVEVEKYNDLREDFVDYVCSGIPNPAPYCKNKCPECVNGRGWCTYEEGKCRGFNPDGERREGE